MVALSGCYTVVNQKALGGNNRRTVVREVTYTERSEGDEEMSESYEDEYYEDDELAYRGTYSDRYTTYHHYYNYYPGYYYPSGLSVGWSWFYDPYWDFVMWPRSVYYPGPYAYYDPYWRDPWYWSAWSYGPGMYSGWYRPYDYAYYGGRYGYYDGWYGGYSGYYGGGGGGGGSHVADNEKYMREDRLGLFGVNNRRGIVSSGGSTSSVAGLTSVPSARRSRADGGLTSPTVNGNETGGVSSSARTGRTTQRALTPTEQRGRSVTGTSGRRQPATSTGAARPGGSSVSGRSTSSAPSGSSTSGGSSSGSSNSGGSSSGSQQRSRPTGTTRRSSNQSMTAPNSSLNRLVDPYDARETAKTPTVNARTNNPRTYFYTRPAQTPSSRSTASSNTVRNGSGLISTSRSTTQTYSVPRSVTPSYSPYPGTSASSGGGYSAPSSSSSSSMSSSSSSQSSSSSSSSGASRSRASTSSSRRR